MAPEMTSTTQRTPPSAVPSSFASLPSLSSAARHAHFAESARLEQAIKANLRRLGYGR
jgi:hypothetical protein